MQLPFIKVLWAGSAQVFTFFVLSGYVLSYKPIKQMRARSPHLQKSLSSSIFRRGMRLFIPAFSMTVIVALLAEAGIYKPAERAAAQHLMDHLENIPPQHASLWNTWNAVWNDIVTMTQITNWGYIQPSIHQHLWTIVIEYRISMLLFLVHTGTAHLRSWMRVAVAGYVFFWFCNTLSPVGSQTALFFAGMILAEGDIALATFREIHDFTSYLAWDPARRDQALVNRLARLTDPEGNFWRGLHLTLFVIGMYFLSCPYNASESTPVYSFLVATLNPSWYRALEHSYWLWTLGAIFMLVSASHSRDIQWIYNNAFSQYAGKLSFALYLAHGPVLHCVEYGMLPLLVTIAEPFGGRETSMGFFVQWFVGFVVSIPMVFYFADMVYRFLDVPSVQLARWFEAFCEEPATPANSPVRVKA
jgi:peptidoglycan/LPS O-acetylase OafA/YrhL